MADAPAKYDLVVSDLVVLECSTGDPEAIRDRLAESNPLPEFAATEEAQTCGGPYGANSAVPASEPADSLISPLRW